MPYILALYFKVYMARKNMTRLRNIAEPLIPIPVKYAKVREHYLNVEKARDFNIDLINEGKGI